MYFPRFSCEEKQDRHSAVICHSSWVHFSMNVPFRNPVLITEMVHDEFHNWIGRFWWRDFSQLTLATSTSTHWLPVQLMDVEIKIRSSTVCGGIMRETSHSRFARRLSLVALRADYEQICSKTLFAFSRFRDDSRTSSLIYFSHLVKRVLRWLIPLL